MFILVYSIKMFISGYIKYVSLAILTIQNSALGLSMRYSRTRNVVLFSSAAGMYYLEIVNI